MNAQTAPVGQTDRVKLFRAEILSGKAAAPLPERAAEGAPRPVPGTIAGDRVEISDAARLLAGLAAAGHAESRAALQSLADGGTDERIAAFLQAYGGLYGVDFLLPAGLAYDRNGRRVRSDVREKLRQELRRYRHDADENAAGGTGSREENRSAGLPRLLAELRARLRRLLR